MLDAHVVTTPPDHVIQTFLKMRHSVSKMAMMLDLVKIKLLEYLILDNQEPNKQIWSIVNSLILYHQLSTQQENY